LNKKNSIISGGALKLINDYREFLGIKGKTKIEKNMIRLIMTHCDLDDKPFDT
jgi:hypothetical protein